MPSVTSVSQVSCKLELALVLHTQNNSSDLVPRVQPIFPCNVALRTWRFGSASIISRALCPKLSFTCSIVDMSDEGTGQSLRTTLF